MDLLDPETFADDVEVEIRCGTLTALPSERLFWRLVHIGQAYEMHRLPMLREDAVLNRAQAQSLAEELDFIASLLPADTALESLIDQIIPLVRACAAEASQQLIVEWP